jgi:hypothetical protein
VHYWATPLEGKLCANQEIALVGGGNSAGQAAVYLASQSAKVWMLVRGADIGASMSRYLVDRIEGHANIEVLTRAQVSGLEGRNGILEAVRVSASTSTADSRSPILDFFIPSRGAARHQYQPPELGNFFLANSLQGPTDGGPPVSYGVESADRRRGSARRSRPLMPIQARKSDRQRMHSALPTARIGSTMRRVSRSSPGAELLNDRHLMERSH